MMIWTEPEIKKLKMFYPHVPTAALADVLGRSVQAVYCQAQLAGLHKSEAFLASPASGRTNGKQGVKTRFKKGCKPWNKGTHFTAGGRSVETRFRKGSKPHNTQPVGAERVTKDGILQRKITDTGYPPKDWKAVHAIIYEQHHGKIPKGHLVIFKDGNRRNFDINNLECISRGENMRRNSHHTRYPKEIAKLIQLRAALNRQINKRSGHEKQDRRSTQSPV